jgi:hypothetical protein
MDVDRAAYVSVETRVEETGRIPQSPSSAILSEISPDADWPPLAPDFFRFITGC